MARPDSEVTRMYRDSGVVTTMCGAVRRIRARSACGVSPVRTTERIGTSGSPIAASSSPIPWSGASKFRWMSFDSAFSGDTYTMRVSSGNVP